MLNVVLCGTPFFVKEFFESFLKYPDKYCIKGVITRAPKLIKNKLNHSKIALWAQENNISLYEVDDINSNKDVENLLKTCDFVLVFAYGKIINKKLLDLPKYGWLNIHPSLLPELRGASPIQYALLKELKKSALTLMKMNEKMDEGDIIAQKKFNINKFHNLNTVFFELSCWGPAWIMAKLDIYFKNLLTKMQKHQLATYSFVIKNKDYTVSSNDSIEMILNKIRAFGYVFLYYDGAIMKCFVAKKYEEYDLFNIAGIAPIFIQLSGKKIMHIRVFLNGFRKKLF